MMDDMDPELKDGDEDFNPVILSSKKGKGVIHDDDEEDEAVLPVDPLLEEDPLLENPIETSLDALAEEEDELLPEDSFDDVDKW